MAIRSKKKNEANLTALAAAAKKGNESEPLVSARFELRVSLVSKDGLTQVPIGQFHRCEWRPRAIADCIRQFTPTDLVDELIRCDCVNSGYAADRGEQLTRLNAEYTVDVEQTLERLQALAATKNSPAVLKLASA